MDIVERLREINALCETLFTDQSHTLVEAANEIERLQKKIERLESIQGRLIGTFRVNMMRLSPEYNHEGFDEVIAALKKGE
jgi:archaellum component FlaC